MTRGRQPARKSRPSGRGAGVWEETEDLELVSFAAIGHSLTTPFALADGSSYARWRVGLDGMVTFKGSVVFGASTEPGDGDILAIPLPVQAARSNNAADLTLGIASVDEGAAASPRRFQHLNPTLLDPAAAVQAPYGDENRYLQLFLQHMISAGTATIASGSSSSGSVPHGVGTTPQPLDFNVIAMNAPSSNPGVVYLADADIDAVNAVFRCKTAISGGTGLNLGWKAYVEPNGAATFDLLVNGDRPWPLAEGCILQWYVEYEAG